jgi:hypothetical protein
MCVTRYNCPLGQENRTIAYGDLGRMRANMKIITGNDLVDGKQSSSQAVLHQIIIWRIFSNQTYFFYSTP